MLQHAVQNQIIKILNTTIAHIENIEIIDRNKKLLQGRIMRYLNREKINVRTLYSTYSSHSGSNMRRGKYNGISYIYPKGIYAS